MKQKEVKEPVATNPDNLIINTAFMTALTLELFIRDLEKRMAMQGASFQREAKQKFTRFLDFTKKALYYAEELTQEIYNVDEQAHWKNIPVWQEESNELARLILLYADRSSNADAVNDIFKFLRSIPGEGIVTEEMLDNYRLKTL